jgi:hypothetical protein
MTLKPHSKSLRGGAVRLTLSAKVANDINALQAGLKNLAERLGHPACATGCDVLHIGLEREFVVNQDAQLNPQPLPPIAEGVSFQKNPFLPVDPIPLRPVNVVVSSSGLDNIEGLNNVVASVLGKLGCAPCCSGFDILFQRELDYFAVDEKLNVQGFGAYR